MTEAGKKEEAPKKDMKEVLAAAETKTCPVQRAQVFVEEFLSEPMCGKCHPCALGSFEALVRLKRLTGGTGEQDDIAALRRIAAQMIESSRCIKGKDTAKFLLASLDAESFGRHLAGRCDARECASYVIYRVIPGKCVMCGDCQDACRYNAIAGKKKKGYESGELPFEIRQKRCVKCGDCVKACTYGAIEIVEEKTVVLV